MSRKTVQIATTEKDGLIYLFAVADDGSVWRCLVADIEGYPRAWLRMPDLPDAEYPICPSARALPAA